MIERIPEYPEHMEGQERLGSSEGGSRPGCHGILHGARARVSMVEMLPMIGNGLDLGFQM